MKVILILLAILFGLMLMLEIEKLISKKKPIRKLISGKKYIFGYQPTEDTLDRNNPPTESGVPDKFDIPPPPKKADK